MSGEWMVATERRFRRNEKGQLRLVRGTRNGVEYYEVSGVDSCSGCTETEDGHLVGRYSSDKRGVTLGNGCDECGYTGKRRWAIPVAFDPSDEPRLHNIDRPSPGDTTRTGGDDATGKGA